MAKQANFVFNVEDENYPTIRIFCARKRQWIELPDEIPGFARSYLVRDPQTKKISIPLKPVEWTEVSARAKMGDYDNLSPERRWEESYAPHGIGIDKTTPPRWIGRRHGARVKTSDITNLL